MGVAMISQKNLNYRIIFLLAVFFCAGIYVVSSAKAQVTELSQDAKKSLEKKQNQLDAINAKIKAYKQIIDLKQRQGSTLSDQIQSLEAQANKLELEININKQKVDDLQGDIVSLSLRITEKESLINSQKQILVELLRTYYSDYSGGAETLIFSANETTVYLNQEGWSTQINDKVSDLLESIKTLRDSLAGERVALEDKKKAADELHIQLTSRNDYLENTKDNKEYLLTKTQAEVTKYDNLVDNLQKQREEIENEIEELEAGKIDQLSGMPAFKKGLFAYPLKKFTVSQGYGKTSFSGKAYKSGKHNGVDFSAPTGTPLYAAASGKVIGTGNLGRYAYGRWVAIDHGNGLVTLYGHMNSISVSKGSKVDQGSKIGSVGSTGYSTGPHVHFTVFSSSSYEVVSSKTVKGLMIPIGATVNPNVYLP
jgi:murein DD-endopeptidase MepM/ murein hydrolase activator NlpD